MRSAAILVGGRASRFGGRDKSALVVDGRAIFDRQLSALRGVADLGEILTVQSGAERNPATPAADEAVDVRPVVDLVPGSGPLGGIHAALNEAHGDVTAPVFILACDMPFVTTALIEYLFSLSAGVDVVVPRTARGYHPLCAVYTKACLDAIGRRLVERRLKVVEVVGELRARVVTADELDRFGDHHRLLSNVNTPAEYGAIVSRA